MMTILHLRFGKHILKNVLQCKSYLSLWKLAKPVFRMASQRGKNHNYYNETHKIFLKF